jgi:hypothetical protein
MSDTRDMTRDIDTARGVKNWGMLTGVRPIVFRSDWGVPQG